MSERRRVVVTGIGAMTPLGLTMDETWRGLLSGMSGISAITQFDPSDLPVQIAGELKGFDPTHFINYKEARRMARCSQLAVATAQAALADASLELPLKKEERVGTLIGSAVGGYERAVEGVDTFRERGLRRVNPFLPIAMLINMPSHHVSCWSGAKGPISTVVSACATGTQAVGEAAEFIRRGVADVMICGGVDAMIHFTLLVGFCAMRALSTRNHEPERASRPFDADRDGFVLSEGAAVCILEGLDHAQARGARVLAEVLGHSSSSDAFHAAQPDPEGQGAGRAMDWALKDAGVVPSDVDYINAHGSATPISDPIETLAIKRVFGDHAYDVPISSTKSMIGHAMGGAGAIEAAVCVRTIQGEIIHPTANLET
ncbi:MAG: beta-ketoacyl-ACP synthase II, partial [Anaerolineae bacterium]